MDVKHNEIKALYLIEIDDLPINVHIRTVRTTMYVAVAGRLFISYFFI